MNEASFVCDHTKDEIVASASGSGSRSVDLDLQCDNLALSLHTRSEVRADLVELAVQVKILSEQLSYAQSQLAEANQKIGFLQAQLLLQQQQLAKACSLPVNERPSNPVHQKLPVY
jgi:hypothetical protein